MSKRPNASLPTLLEGLGRNAEQRNKMRVALLNCREFINAGAPVGGSSVANMHKAERWLAKINAEINEALG